MALVASICSQLTWLFGHCESSPLGQAPPSLPLALEAPPDSLNVTLSFLFNRALKWRQPEPSEVSPCISPFWLQWGEASGWGWSSSLVVFAEDRDSCDRDLLSPLKIILKWAMGLSESSVRSSELVSAGHGSCRGSVFPTSSGTGSYSETIIVGIMEPGTPLLFPEEVPGFSGRSADSGSENGFSFTASVLELCGEQKREKGNEVEAAENRQHTAKSKSQRQHLKLWGRHQTA